MRYARWVFWLLTGAVLFGFLHYTLPQRDIVRIVGTENRRIEFGANSIFWASPDAGTAAGTSRDVFFINTLRPDGRPMVYRNEDTGWGWPPYFKMDTFSLQSEAQALISPAESPKWVAVTHYGWRSEFFTIFPNAVALRQVAGPDVTLIPWLNLVILASLGFVAVMAVRMWMQFRERVLDPALDRVGDAFARAGGEAELAAKRARSRLGRLWDRLTGARRS